MLTHVRVKNQLTAEKTVSVVNIANGSTTCLRLPVGVLSIASQETGIDREASVGVGNGMEVLFTNTQPYPRLSMMCHNAQSATALQHIDVRAHAFDASYKNPAYEVQGLAGLALHLIRRRHCFDGLARRPLPLGDLSPMASEPRIRGMGLKFPAGTGASNLRNLGTLCENKTPAANTCIAAGMSKYTSFFMFNSNMISRLTAHFPKHNLPHARGVCLNMALATHMSADEGTVVVAETLTQAAVAPELYNSLLALRAERPCSSVVCRSPEGNFRRSVYDAHNLGLGFAMFSKADVPVVVGLVGDVERWRPCMPCMSIEGDWRKGSLLPPERPEPPVLATALSAGAVAAADMLFVHAVTSSGELASVRHTLKNACYEKHAAQLDNDERAVLLTLCREDSAGVFAMGAELVFVNSDVIATPLASAI